MFQDEILVFSLENFGKKIGLKHDLRKRNRHHSLFFLAHCPENLLLDYGIVTFLGYSYKKILREMHAVN